jgi:hypothetical protein
LELSLSDLLAFYPNLTWRERAHMTVRWLVCPLRKIAAYVPPRGVILD